MHEEAIQTLPLVLDHAGIDRAGLVGHSDGASIALIFAATYPERVDALVLEAPHVFVEDLSIASITRMKTAFDTTDLAERMRKYHDRPEVAFRGWNDVWLNPAFRAWNLEAYLPRIDAPTLVIQGVDDEYGTVRQVDAIATQLAAPVETLMLPDCGHSPHRDQSGRVLDAIAKFLARVPRSRSTAG
jgi:pimeloyl-ACP methyl ester carboxylesterase